ncbi:MAG TPA: hypothetical protein VLJ88_04700 [Propionibacteriaceae bacterium]|nr:hypothetical protein [Propionibacteriaceae bacterium]
MAALALTALVLAFGVSIVAGREDSTLEVAPVPVDRVGLNPSPATSANPFTWRYPTWTRSVANGRPDRRGR